MGCASEHVGQLAFGQRIPGLSAQPVRGHRGVIDGASLRYRLVTLPADGDGRPPGDPGGRLRCLVWCVALRPAATTAATRPWDQPWAMFAVWPKVICA